MEIVAIVLCVVLLIALAWVIFQLSRAREAAREIRREKLGSVDEGHREMVSAHEGSVAPRPSSSASTSEPASLTAR